MRIGIFGGSFNPVHAGHLKLAFEAMSELNLERVIFVPSRQNPLKGRPMPERGGGDRIARLRKAIKRVPFFSLSFCEIRRKGLSYTVDTLEHFKKKFGNKTVLYFLVGADSLKNFGRWKSPKRILELCRLAFFSRPDYPAGRLPKGALYIPMDALDISSTRIRGSSSSR